jgi:hypothetical protein
MDDSIREPISRQGEPTPASPGSPRKIRVLMERAARREPLFHPLDGSTSWRSSGDPSSHLPGSFPEDSFAEDDFAEGANSEEALREELADEDSAAETAWIGME